VPEAVHSRAFQNIVQGDDDVIGLIAYGLYKRAIREDAALGNRVPGDRRNPSLTTVNVHRSAAEQLLVGVIERAIEQATPDIEHSALRTALSTTSTEIKQHVTARTVFGPALLTNFLAWIVTLAATVLIVWLATKPDIPAIVAL
jgi:hypothetical protein